MNTSDVLIVGAGPTGMTLAIELKRAGMSVRIIDKSDHPALYSQALVVQARTLEQFQRYGIASKAVAKGKRVTGAEMWSRGRRLVSVAFEGIASRYPYVLFLPQKETEALLNAELESLGLRIERKVELVSFTQEANEVHSLIRHADGRDEQVSTQWLAGCDGAHSAVRTQAAIPFEGKGVDLSFFLGDLEIDGADAPDNQLSLHLHDGDVVFMGRLTDKLTRVIVALHSKQDEKGPRNISIKDFQDAVNAAEVKVNIRAAEWMTPFRVSDRQAKHYRAGRVFLAGDASHIHSPVGGQGMNTGIQDAANLGWKLAAVARGADERILDSYEEERGEVGKALLRFTERGLGMATTSNPLLASLRDAFLPLAAKPKAFRHAMVAFVSETAIEYRSSSIVADYGGDGALRAGDRMPDLQTSEKDTLLGTWTDAGHLAVLLGSSDAEGDEMQHRLGQTKVLSVSPAQLDEEGRRTVGSEKKLFLIRPDGYVGFRGPLSKRFEIDGYASQNSLH